MVYNSKKSTQITLVNLTKGLTNMAFSQNNALFLFNQGTNYKAYEYLGNSVEIIDGKEYRVFRVWAPNADKVFLCADFTDWETGLEMISVGDGGVWEVYVDNAKEFDCYKYRIVNGDKVVYKADPYAFHAETPPATASKVFDISGFTWGDAEWMTQRYRNFKEKGKDLPMNIYEMHLESWKKKEGDLPYSYSELADVLAPYLKQMGYTHVELMPVMEHPFGGSWGYQITGYYAPTSRFGTPHDFMSFVDKLHRAGIGVILDWVPAHFPKDAHGLYEFDGHPLYEFQGWDRMEHKGWGTRRFDVGRNEVQSFLISNAVYWTELYHADGLRVDAVASMLYLDYDRRPGEWIPNIYGENKCLEAISFFQKLNSYMKKSYPDVLMIAEESTACVQITSFDNGGLGFDYKWNMGWMNDVLSYCETDPFFRKHCHEKTTFSMMYAFTEKFILPVSHDEVVHGKKSLLDRMPGNYDDKFAGDRAFYTYMMAHPGKKLNFMGNEIGQFAEWNYASQIEWFLLDYDNHEKLRKFYSDMNNIYLSRCELWEQDNTWAGFDWMMADNRDDSVLAFMRYNKYGDGMLAVINFTPVERKNFKIGIPYEGYFSEIINSDNTIYGGKGLLNKNKIKSKKDNFDGRPYSLTIDLPGLSGIIFESKRVNRNTTKKDAPVPAKKKNTQNGTRQRADGKEKA